MDPRFCSVYLAKFSASLVKDSKVGLLIGDLEPKAGNTGQSFVLCSGGMLGVRERPLPCRSARSRHSQQGQASAPRLAWLEVQ